MRASDPNGPRPRLSVAMIVRDEQDVLAESIQSARALADEIVVLDTGSRDDTPQVARRLGASVYRAAWEEDFSLARNRCLEHVTGQWVLWLDAGERVEAGWEAQLREFVDQHAEARHVYTLMVQLPPAEATTCGEQAARLRLMPNLPHLRFEGRVRETLRPSIQVLGLDIQGAPGRILRHPRQHDPVRKALLADRDLRLATLEAAEIGRPTARLLLARGEACGTLGAREEARQAFLDAIEAAECGSTEMLEAYYGLLSTYQDDPFLGTLQRNVCLEALEIFPLDAQLLLAMGNYLQAQGNLDLAARCFQTALEHGQLDLETWHLSELPEMAADCLSLTRQVQGRHDEAAATLERALQRNPDSRRLTRRLMELHVAQGRAEAALPLADRLGADAQKRVALADAIRGACKAARHEWTAALGYLQGAYVAGCRDPLCLRWLAVTLLSNGQTAAAAPVLREWQQLEPDNPEMQTYLAAVSQRGAGACGRAKPAEPASAASATRQLRLDPATVRLEAAPAILPIITQMSSADTATSSDA